MNEKEEKKLRQYVTHLLNNYGYEFTTSDPVLPVMYVIHRELVDNKVGNEKVAEAIRLALSKLNPIVYNFDKGEAWKFQLGGALKWLFISLGCTLSIGIALLFWRQYSDVEKARNIISAATTMQQQFLQNIQKNKRGYLYLQLAEQQGDSINFYYEYEKIDERTIRIYVGTTK